MFTTKKTGVTLLELLVVMTIISIITAASLPSFLKFTKTARLRACARDITTALRSARRYAITKRTAYAVTIYLNDYAITSMRNAISFYETANNVETKRSAANIYYTDDDVAKKSLTFSFSPRGTTDGDTIEVWDSDYRHIKVAVQGTTGRVKVGDIE